MNKTHTHQVLISGESRVWTRAQHSKCPCSYQLSCSCTYRSEKFLITQSKEETITLIKKPHRESISD